MGLAGIGPGEQSEAIVLWFISALFMSFKWIWTSEGQSQIPEDSPKAEFQLCQMRGNTALCFPGTLFDEKRLALVKMPNREDRILGNYSGTLSWTLAILYIFSHFSIKCTLIFEKLYKFYERFPFLLTSISQPHSYHSKNDFLLYQAPESLQPFQL